MSEPHRHAIAATTIFDGARTHYNSAVVVEGARIVSLGPSGALPSQIPVRTLPEGVWLAPGFIDVQVNGGGDELFNDDPSPGAMVRIAAAHRRFGTTAVMPTLISDSREKMQAALDAMKALPADCGVVGLHLEGPFLSPGKPGVHDPAMIRSPTAEDLEILTARMGAPTVVTLAPEEVPAGFIAALVKAGVRVALGHSMATYEQTKAALAEGLTGFTHLFNAVRPLDSREPGPIASALESPHTFFGMIVDGAHVHPAMLKLALRGAAQPMLVTDAMPPVGGRSSTFSLQGRPVYLRDGTCRTDSGTLAGSALDMASAVRNCVRLLGVPLPEALGYASTAPARFLGLGDRLGMIASGYRADMVALEPEGVEVIATWVGGKSR